MSGYIASVFFPTSSFNHVCDTCGVVVVGVSGGMALDIFKGSDISLSVGVPNWRNILPRPDVQQ